MAHMKGKLSAPKKKKLYLLEASKKAHKKLKDFANSEGTKLKVEVDAAINFYVDHRLQEAA